MCLKLANIQEERAVRAPVREPRPGKDSFPGSLRPRVGILPGGIRGLQGQVWGAGHRAGLVLGFYLEEYAGSRGRYEAGHRAGLVLGFYLEEYAGSRGRYEAGHRAGLVLGFYLEEYADPGAGIRLAFIQREIYPLLR